MKRTFMTLAIIGLTGCATPEYYNYTPPAATYSSEDRAFCEYEAVKATASTTTGTVTNSYDMANTLANDIQTGIRRGELMALCLRNRQSAKQSQVGN